MPWARLQVSSSLSCKVVGTGFRRAISCVQLCDEAISVSPDFARRQTLGLTCRTVELVVMIEAKPCEVFQPIIIAPLVEVSDLALTRPVNFEEIVA
jgi:hypothetical protein